jgi:iron complex outermembrane receptor protein
VAYGQTTRPASPGAAATAATTGRAESEAMPLQSTGDGAADELLSLSLEELMEVQVTVVAAGKREQTQSEAAASINVVTAEQIELLGHRNLAELLRNQRGFYLHTDGLNWFTGVRGFLRPNEWNARILMLTDGRPAREPIYGVTHLDQDFTLPIEAIKRVEIVRGPGSALYGGNAVFGVINVVTKDGADLNGGMARVQGGSHETGRLVALYGTKTEDGWDLIGGAAGYTSVGEDDIAYDDVNDPALNFGHIRDADEERAMSGFFKVRKGGFTGAVDGGTRRRDNRAATYLASFFEPLTQREDRINASLSFDHEVEQGKRLHAMVYYGSYYYHQPIGYAGDPDPRDTDEYHSAAESQWVGQELHYQWQVNPRLHLLVGADATQSLEARQFDHDYFGFEQDLDDSHNACGAFAEGELKVTNWLTTVGGVRVDRVQEVGTSLSPRAAAIVNAGKGDTFKFLYGRAFRAPNIYERTYFSDGSFTPNPDLEPEVVDTYELIWERHFHSGWRTSVGGFVWRMSDAMDDVILPDGSAQPQNVGVRSARGVEAEAARRWKGGGQVRVYATYVRAEDDGDHLAISPEFTAGAAVVIPVLNPRTFVGVDAQYVSRMENDLGDNTDPTYVTNLVLTSREFLRIKNLDVQVGVYDLFGNDARLPRGDAFNHVQPMLNWPETRVMAGLTYRF